MQALQAPLRDRASSLQSTQPLGPDGAQVANGGELFDRIVEQGYYSEKDAANMFRTMVGVIAHCHNMGVMHRDIKPEVRWGRAFRGGRWGMRPSLESQGLMGMLDRICQGRTCMRCL